MIGLRGIHPRLCACHDATCIANSIDGVKPGVLSLDRLGLWRMEPLQSGFGGWNKHVSQSLRISSLTARETLCDGDVIHVHFE